MLQRQGKPRPAPAPAPSPAPGRPAPPAGPRSASSSNAAASAGSSTSRSTASTPGGKPRRRLVSSTWPPDSRPSSPCAASSASGIDVVQDQQPARIGVQPAQHRGDRSAVSRAVCAGQAQRADQRGEAAIAASPASRLPRTAGRCSRPDGPRRIRPPLGSCPRRPCLRSLRCQRPRRTGRRDAPRHGCGPARRPALEQRPQGRVRQPNRPRRRHPVWRFLQIVMVPTGLRSPRTPDRRPTTPERPTLFTEPRRGQHPGDQFTPARRACADTGLQREPLAPERVPRRPSASAHQASPVSQGSSLPIPISGSRRNPSRPMPR